MSRYSIINNNESYLGLYVSKIINEEHHHKSNEKGEIVTSYIKCPVKLDASNST